MEARSLLLGLVCVGAAACATDGGGSTPAAQPPLYPPAVFAHRVSTTEVSVFWNCTEPEPGALRVDGVVQNTGGGSIRFAEVEIVSVDARDRTIASMRSAVRDILLQTNQISPFQLGVRTVGAEARIDLYYEYWLPGLFRLGGVEGSPQRFRARDICSETQHRIPKPQSP
jgi:hypothetical protein